MNALSNKRARIDEIIGQWPTIDDARSPPTAAGPSSLLHDLAVWLCECHARSRQRRQLQMLDYRLLQDIGVTSADAAAEAAKWPWMK